MRGPLQFRKLPGAFFVILLGCGYLSALTNLFFTHADADLKPGLGPHDIIARYHGDPTVSRLAYMATGPMHKHFKSEDEYKALIAWIDAGGKEADYEKAEEILDSRCTKCHSSSGKADFATMESYQEVSVFLKPNPGISWQQLVMLSHQHFFGMGLLFFALSTILWTQTAYPNKLKALHTTIGFLGVFCDVGGWWLTKLMAPFAYLVMAGGAMTGLFFGLGILAVWYDFVFVRSVSGWGSPDAQ